LKKKYLIYHTIIALLLCQFAMAQTIPLDKLHFRRYTTKEGLLNNANKAFYQDKQGYMWIGGFGLQRFDGNRFKTFLTTENSKIISQIIGDNKNNLFVLGGVVGEDGLGFVDKTAKKIVLLQDSITVKGKKEKLVIYKMVADANGNIWAKHLKGYAILRQGTKQLENISDKWSLKSPHSMGNNFSISSDNCIWQTTIEDGIIRINVKDETVTTKENCNPSEKIFSYKYKKGETRIYKDNDNNIWFIEAKENRYISKINAITLQTDSVCFAYKVPFDKRYKNIWLENIYCDSKGTVWFIPGENVGLGRYNKVENKLDILYGSTIKENGLHSTITLATAGASFLEDREGNFWMSGDGVMYVNPYGQRFATYKTNDVVDAAFKNPEEHFTSASSTPNTIVQVKNNNIYVGYYGLGLMKFNNEFTNPVNIPLPPNIHNLLWNMFTIDSISLYIFDQYKHLIIYNTETKSFKVMPDNLWKPRYVLHSYVENDTTVWLAHNNYGISKFNPKTFAIKAYKDIIIPNATNNSEVYEIIPEGNDFFWLSVYRNGLQLFDKKLGKTVKQIMPTNKKEACDENTILSVTKYNADTLLLSTEVGLIIYNIKTDKKTYINSANGLPDNFCYSSMVDANRNFVWINTYTQGICKLNLKTSKVTAASTEEGNVLLSGNTANFIMSNGDLLFTQGNGFTTIKAPIKKNNYAVSDVLINDIILNSISINADSVLQLKKGLVLDENAKEIIFDFTCLAYWNNYSIQYYSYLKGFDTGWVAMGNKSQLEYRGLAAGDYTLKLKCTYANGDFCKEITTLKIYIKPAFYKSNWAILIYILLGIFLLYSFLTWRNKQALNVQALKTEKVQNELEIEQVSTYFAKSLTRKTSVNDVLEDVVNNLMGKLGFENCIIYLCNEDKTKLVQKAGFGSKGSEEALQKKSFSIEPNKDVLGNVAFTKQATIVTDTNREPLYKPNEIVRLSKITVPILNNNQLVGIIDAEHPNKNYYTQRHLNLLNTIGTLIANKINEMEINLVLENQEIAIKEVKQKLVETELAALRSQMNPHFIFNSLNSINSFIIENNTKLASEYLTKFSRLIRLILENSKNDLITLDKELETLRLYLLMESIRFKNKFTYKINIEDDVNLEQIKLPPTTLQPFVENAIWHGILHLESEGHLEINIGHSEKNTLLLQIKDNGVGRTKSAILKSKTNANKSYGIAITEQRLLQSNAFNKVEIIDMFSNDNIAKGTIVNIYIKD
jgi:LytS/YehU family sensor histidine kinase/ligand-binding sensor domain-containing protein